MKTTLFGYAKDEVDEQINSLRNQIDTLMGRVTNLTAELSSRTLGVDERAEQTRESEIQSAKIQQLEHENADLKGRLSVARAESADLQRKAEYIGEIYLSAYAEADKIRANFKENEKEQFKAFNDRTDAAETAINNAIDSIVSRQSEFNSYVAEERIKVKARIKTFATMLASFCVQTDNMFDELSGDTDAYLANIIAQTEVLRGSAAELCACRIELSDAAHSAQEQAQAQIQSTVKEQPLPSEQPRSLEQQLRDITLVAYEKGKSVGDSAT